MSSHVKAGCAISTLVAALALLPLLFESCAAADAWPNRPIHFIVTLGPGSGVDIGARLFADKLSARWGQPVVVENRPGGDGMVAITSFLSAHDDHTLLVSPVSSFTAHPYFHDKLPYDPRDLIPIARISKTVVAVSVPTSLHVSSLKELEALARAKPGQLNWTTATGFTDFVFAGYLHTVGLKMAKVPYKNPAGAVTDLAAGVIQVYRLRDRASASGGWNCESACGHQSRTRPGNPQRSDCSRGGLSIARIRRPGWIIWSARDRERGAQQDHRRYPCCCLGS